MCLIGQNAEVLRAPIQGYEVFRYLRQGDLPGRRIGPGSLLTGAASARHGGLPLENRNLLAVVRRAQRRGPRTEAVARAWRRP